ncbi:MAG: hypothetical protein MO853_08610 [Candidatus Protistobacter heckmanni]|nr:hypothetical protein [Candidatus Protistobacter heckmanni]
MIWVYPFAIAFVLFVSGAASAQVPVPPNNAATKEDDAPPEIKTAPAAPPPGAPGSIFSQQSAAKTDLARITHISLAWLNDMNRKSAFVAIPSSY